MVFGLIAPVITVIYVFTVFIFKYWLFIKRKILEKYYNGTNKFYYEKEKYERKCRIFTRTWKIGLIVVIVSWILFIIILIISPSVVQEIIDQGVKNV